MLRWSIAETKMPMRTFLNSAAGSLFISASLLTAAPTAF
jgi:hypothetical protein